MKGSKTEKELKDKGGKCSTEGKMNARRRGDRGCKGMKAVKGVEGLKEIKGMQ